MGEALKHASRGDSGTSREGTWYGRSCRASRENLQTERGRRQKPLSPCNRDGSSSGSTSLLTLCGTCFRRIHSEWDSCYLFNKKEEWRLGVLLRGSFLLSSVADFLGAGIWQVNECFPAAFALLRCCPLGSAHLWKTWRKAVVSTVIPRTLASVRLC